MKWRVILAVCFVLTLFAGFASLYVNTFVRKHQHAIILFVVNGLDLNTLNLARQQLGRSALRSQPDDPLIGDVRRNVGYRTDVLNLDSFWNIALMSVQEPGQPVPDEGADATALACGQRVDNGYVAMNARNNKGLPTLIYAAEQAQRETGLVTTGSLVDPTAVAFYSTTKGTPEPYRNAEDLIYSHINVILGGGEQYFIPATVSNEWGRTDGSNLFDEARDEHYKVIHSREDLLKISRWRSQIFGIFAPGSFYFSALQPEVSRQPSLAEMTHVAITSLSGNMNDLVAPGGHGYFLVVEDSLVARASEQNLGRMAENEVAEVDDAIQTALEDAGPDALIIVTNNYSLGATGPLSDAPIGSPTADAKAKSIPTSVPVPILTAAWLAGPGGVPATLDQQDWLRQRYEQGWFSTNAAGMLQPQGAFRFQPQASPTAEPAWVASRGEGSSELRGFFNNTDLFDLISEQF